MQCLLLLLLFIVIIGISTIVVITITLRTGDATPNVVSGCVLHHRVQNHWTPWWDLVGVAVCWHPGLQRISEEKSMHE